MNLKLRMWLHLVAAVIFLFAEVSAANTPAQSISIESSQIKTLVDPLVVKEYVKESFTFAEPVKTEVLSIGVNDIYLVEVGSEKYILRLSRADKKLTLTDSTFLFELVWLEFLNEHQVPVSYPIRRVDQQLFGTIEALEGSRYATLFSYAEGSTDLNEEQAFILGRSLAQLHQVSNDFTPGLERDDLDVDQLIDQPLVQIKLMLDQTWEQEFKLLDNLAEELKHRILGIDKTKETYGVIAGDIHGYNQHFTKDNQLTMFDFEFCAYGYRVYDIATFRWSRGSNNEELWNAFLNGYQSIRKLNDSELEAIDAFVQARSLWWILSFSKMPECQNLFNDDFWKTIFSQFETFLLEKTT